MSLSYLLKEIRPNFVESHPSIPYSDISREENGSKFYIDSLLGKDLKPNSPIPSLNSSLLPTIVALGKQWKDSVEIQRLKQTYIGDPDPTDENVREIMHELMAELDHLYSEQWEDLVTIGICLVLVLTPIFHLTAPFIYNESTKNVINSASGMRNL